MIKYDGNYVFGIDFSKKDNVELVRRKILRFIESEDSE